MSKILIHNDARPVMGSLLKTAATHGFKPEEIDDGEEITNLNKDDLGGRSQVGFTRAYAGEVDELVLSLRHKSGYDLRVHCMFGNDPEDMLTDWTVPEDDARHEGAEDWKLVAQAFLSRWTGKSWPKRKRVWADAAGYVDVD